MAIFALSFTLVLSSCLFPRVRTGIPNRLRRCLYLLTRTSYASYLANSPFCDSLYSQYALLSYYHDANLELAAYAPGRAVFFGDSLIQNWATKFPSAFFPGKPYINRGIGHQTTGQMIWRFHQDVIQLHPDTVVILAGTNDIAFNKAVDVYTERNLQTMVEMARHHGIRVVLCTVPPLNMGDIAQQAYLDGRVRMLNDWLLRYSVQQHLSLIDDFAALSDVTGRMAPSLTVDGVHPNAAGYAIMRQLAQQAIDSPPKN